MDNDLIKRYNTARKEGHRARVAYRIAKTPPVKERLEWSDSGAASCEIDGIKVRVTTDTDGWDVLRDDFYGKLSGDYENRWCIDRFREKYHTDDTSGYIGWDKERYYVHEQTGEENYRYYRASGMSRHDAWLRTKQDVRRGYDIFMGFMNGEYTSYFVSAEAYIEIEVAYRTQEIVLAESSAGSVDDCDGGKYLRECAEELVDEVVRIAKSKRVSAISELLRKSVYYLGGMGMGMGMGMGGVENE